MKIDHIELSKLKPAEYNPRTITKKQFKDLTNSISKFGIVDPLVVNSDYTIIGGHMRFRILLENNKKQKEPVKAPCVILDLSKEDEKELNIRLNKNGGEWDFDMLSDFDVPELKDWGFKEIELGLNIDKIEEEKPDKWLVSIKTEDVLEAEKIHLELIEQGYNATLKKSV
jgi:ParB-like chromosome segregation protein Spo0J